MEDSDRDAERVDPRQPFRVENLFVDPEQGLIRGPGGAEQADPKVVAVLVELARRPGRIVSREALLDRIWRTSCVSDDVVSRCIYCLRGHFEAAAGDPASRGWIKTLPRRGYRLDASVAAADRPASARGKPNKRSLAAGFGLVAVAIVLLLEPEPESEAPLRVPSSADEAKSLAVVPLSGRNLGESHRFLGYGIAESVTVRLANSLPNRVIASASAIAARDAGGDVPEIAERLGVTHIVDIAIRKDGERIGISAQLVHGASRRTLWADRWSTTLAELQAVEDRIARAVATALNAGDGDLDRPAADPAIPPEAHIDALHARFLLHRRSPGDLREAARLFERATAKAPQLTAAWAGLASAAWLDAATLLRDAGAGDERRRLLEQAESAARQAIALDPDHAEALLRLSRIAAQRNQNERARALYLRARRAAPNDPTLLAMDAGLAARNENHADASALLERALHRDPLNVAWRGNLAIYLHRIGRLEDARAEARRVLALADGGMGDAMRALLIEIALAQGRMGDAAAQVESITDPVERAYSEALLHSRIGNDASAQAAIRRLRGLADPSARLRLAEAHAYRGELASAVHVLRRIVSRLPTEPNNPDAMLAHGSIASSRALARLRDHAEWSTWVGERPAWDPGADAPDGAR